MATQEKLRARLEEREEWLDRLDRSLVQTEIEVAQLRHRVSELESTLQETTASRRYQFACHLARATRLIAPAGTGRRRVLHLSYRGLRAVPKLRDRQWVWRKVKGMAGRSAEGIAWRLPRDWFGQGLARLAGRTWPGDLPRFSTFDRVEASIVIPVFNHWRDTLACLKSIVRETKGLPYEVIVVDDGSSDETMSMLRQVKGLVVLKNEKNLGFIGTSNHGASAARGDYLVFLNNDTVVTEGWLTALRDTFRVIPEAGYVGAKLVYPDGRLQEAGAMIWRDATGRNYGRQGNPDHPRYNFAREVHYCSGACVMVPRELFWEVGGFDSYYAPAYYEDTDLAFKIRAAGRKVIYQPLARIIHFEGLSSGTSLASGVKSYQAVNRWKFLERWMDQLELHAAPPCPGQGDAYVRESELEGRVRVLVIDHRLPTPDRDAGSVRMMEMLRSMTKHGHCVRFIPGDLHGYSPYLEQLQGIGVEVIHWPHYASIAQYLKQHGREIDVAIIARAGIVAEHMVTVRYLAPRAKIVFDTVDLHFLREERQASVKQDAELRLLVANRKRKELQLALRADVTLVVSPIEKAILERECPGIEVRVLPTIQAIEHESVPGVRGRDEIVFIGGFQHPPNVDAVLYLVDEILPMIRQRYPEVVLRVIGPDAPAEITELASPGIEIMGFVPDVKPWFDRARVTVAPIRFGAGVKGKVNQSMALGVPTVVTSVAAEGMYLIHEVNAMIAGDAAGFADCVMRLFGDDDLWERISRNGRENVRRHFSVEVADQILEQLVEDLVHSTREEVVAC